MYLTEMVGYNFIIFQYYYLNIKILKFYEYFEFFWNFWTSLQTRKWKHSV